MANYTEDVPTQPLEDEAEDLTPPLSLTKAVHARRSEYVRRHRTKVKIGTWNVAACPGTDKDLASWFVSGKGLAEDMGGLDLANNPAVERDDSKQMSGNDVDADTVRIVGDDDIGIYVLGLQEIVDLNTTKEYMNRAVYTDTSAMDKWKAALEAAMPPGYELITAEQMTGLLILVYASPKITSTINNVSTKQVGTGLLGYFGNKGAVTTRLLLGETTRLVFVNCHLASGIGSAPLERRCWDIGQILSKTQFDPIVQAGVVEDEGDKIGDEDFCFWFGDLNFRLDGLPGDDIRRLLTLHAKGEYDLSNGKKTTPGDEGVIVMKNSDSDDDTTTISSVQSKDESFDSESTLPDPDDFPEDPSQDPASLQATLDSLLPHDQLRKLIKQRKLFHDGWREGPITFLPSYKYDVGTVGLFDSSEKQRAPSWCDRILFRTRKDKQDYEMKIKEEEESKKKDEEMRSRGIEEDDDVLFSYDPDTDGDDQPREPESYEYDEYDENDDNGLTDVMTKDGFRDSINLDIYTSHQRITSSDHKPITSIFTLDYDAVVPELKAKVHGEVAWEFDRAENEGRPGITVVVEGGNTSEENVLDFGDVVPTERKTCSLMVANTGGVAATFSFVEKPNTEEFDIPIPDWLQTSFIRQEPESRDVLGKSVTLEPGDTVSALVEVQVTSVSHIRALNEGSAGIEEVLILRIEDGRDYFLPVRGNWQPTCLGRSIDELIRIPDGGIRKFIQDKDIKGAIPYDSDVHCSAPKELFKLTEVAQTLAERCIADQTMLEDAALPRDPRWPLDSVTWTTERGKFEDLRVALVNALDNDKPLLDAFPVEASASSKLEALSSVLLLFLESLTDGLVPTHLWAKITTALPNLSSTVPTAWPDTKTQILDILATAPSHNIAFVFLTATLCRVTGELSPLTIEARPLGLSKRLSFRRGATEDESVKKRRIREKSFADIVGPLVCRTSDKEKGGKDKARLVVEMFLRREEDG